MAVPLSSLQFYGYATEKLNSEDPAVCVWPSTDFATRGLRGGSTLKTPVHVPGSEDVVVGSGS